MDGRRSVQRAVFLGNKASVPLRILGYGSEAHGPLQRLSLARADHAFGTPGAAASKRASNFGVPKPVTGSHPAVAFHFAPPGTPEHPTEYPAVMSVNAAELLYSHGFRNPSGGCPCDFLAAFSSAIAPAKAGPLALVPPTLICLPLSMTAKLDAWAATSGTARFDELKYSE